ncbi:MAG: TIGR01777 family oxidoreductase [Methylococcaceae bacterium]|nr:TIGR01777 family oxidoreductase [Methylococcaceae bacterium]
MKILMTGGTGSIGRVLCRQLQAGGHELTVLSRTPMKVGAICGKGITAISSLAELKPSVHFDAVVNLAGEVVIGPPWTEKRKKQLWDSRVGLTERLVDFLRTAEVKPAVLINASATGYYGDGGDSIIDEDTQGSGGFGHLLCDGWEKAAKEAESLGVRVCLVRFGPVLMPHGGLLKSMQPVFKLGLGARLGDGRQWMPWIHYHDLLNMVELLLEKPELSGTFNGVSPQPVTNAEFTACLARHLHRPAFLFAPAFALKRVLGEMGRFLLEGQRALPKRLIEAGFEFRHASLDSALSEIFGQ